MSYDKVNVQDAFLNHIRKNKIALTIFLVNGVKLQGHITWFDANSILLKRDGNVQLIYKHAISTMMPHSVVNLFNAAEQNNRFSENNEQDDEE